MSTSIARNGVPDRDLPPAATPPGDRTHEPIRADLYGLEALEAHARELAGAAAVGPARRREGPLLRRLQENGRRLAGAHAQIAAATARGEPLSPDGKGLLENYYSVEEVRRGVQHPLPRRYYHELPKLAAG